mmetsp:Transcript_26416/g.58395  ORF Transcript_26416/g.58395 Transcript_26416/m.58395 type:complete len:96 (+) Transcript_26416:3-290(+)
MRKEQGGSVFDTEERCGERIVRNNSSRFACALIDENKPAVFPETDQHLDDGEICDVTDLHQDPLDLLLLNPSKSKFDILEEGEVDGPEDSDVASF